MRRSTVGAFQVAREQRNLAEHVGKLDAERTIALLEPHLTPSRVEKMRHIFASRIGSVSVVMDAPHDPHNGAAILRTCDAFGIGEITVIERLETFLAHQSVARGSERWVEVTTVADARSAIDPLVASGFTLVATHPEGDWAPEDLEGFDGKLAMVLGNEREGISDELRAACRHSVRVPMRGFAESLNVSVTAALLLFSATRRRAGDLSEAEKNRLLARAFILSIPHAREVLEAKGYDLPVGAVG